MGGAPQLLHPRVQLIARRLELAVHKALRTTNMPRGPNAQALQVHARLKRWHGVEVEWKGLVVSSVPPMR